MTEGSRSGPAPGGGAGFFRDRGQQRTEGAIAVALAACAAVSVLVMVVMVTVLLREAIGFFFHVSPWEFMTATRWTPLFREKHFGILPLLTGSLLVVTGAAALALPAGFLAAVYLSEHAGRRMGDLLRAVLGVLAGIPTVVYGYFALTLVTPAIRRLFPEAGTFNGASASIALGVMVLPTVALLSEDALRGVSNALKEAALSLGARPRDVVLRVVVPAALPGILASFILAVTRALGETMVVAIAAGNFANMTVNPLDSVQTMTAFILQAAQGNMVGGTLEYRTLFAVGAVLFILTVGMNSASRWILARFGRVGR